MTNWKGYKFCWVFPKFVAVTEGVMEADKPTTMLCTLLAIDHTDFSYRVCSVCERTLPDNPTSLCKFCSVNAFNPRFPRSKRLFRLLVTSLSSSSSSIFLISLYPIFEKLFALPKKLLALPKKLLAFQLGFSRLTFWGTF